MVKIPDQSQMSAPQTPTYKTGGIIASDLGLDSVGQALGRAGQGQQAIGDAQAKAAIERVQSAHLANTDRTVAEYNGDKPGLAAGVTAAFDAQAEEERARLKPDARAAFEQYYAQQRVQNFNRVSEIEATRSAQRVKEAQDAQVRVQATNAGAVVTASFFKTQQPLDEAFDGSDPHFADTRLANFDAAAKAALDGASPDVKPQLAVSLASQRVSIQLQSLGMEAHARGAYIANTTADTLDKLTNTVLSAPGSIDTALPQGEAAIAHAPAALQDKLRKEFQSGVASAHIRGLLLADNREQALAELKSGRFDTMLSPQSKEQLLALATHEQDAEQRSLNRTLLMQSVDSAVLSLQQTGKAGPIDYDAIRKDLGPAMAAQVQHRVEKAQLVHDATVGMEGLSDRDIATRLEGLRPTPGAADYADQEKAYEDAVKAAQRAQQVRQTDPGRAARTNPAIQAKWAAFLANPNAATAQAFGDASMAFQVQVGVAPTSRRILPREEAAAMVDPLTKPVGPHTVGAMQDLAGTIAHFGPYAGQVLKELKQTGTGGGGLPAPMAALLAVAGDNPAALYNYSHALGSIAGVKLDKAGMASLDGEISSSMARFNASVLPVDGGPELAQGLHDALVVSAKGLMAQGIDAKEAARRVSAQLADRYVYRQTWRMPAQMQGIQVAAAVPTGGGGGKLLQNPFEPSGPAIPERALDVSGFHASAPSHLAAPEAVQLASWRMVRDLVGVQADGSLTGAGLLAAGDPREHLDEGQKRARYADQVAHHGVWVATQDDGGLMLTLRTNRGVQPVLDKDGKPVVRTWQQLMQRAAKP